MGGLDIVSLVGEAEGRIRPYIRKTPLETSPGLAAETGLECWVKLENLQHTGSFKLRGAVSKILSLGQDELQRGVIAASTGNHGAAVAFAARRLDVEATIYVPETASSSKVGAVRRLGAEVVFVGQDGVEAEVRARAESEASGRAYISPYNDPAVIGGQGTVGVEIDEQLETVDLVYVAVGGGGLISGVAGYLKSRRPGVRVVGCSPEQSAVMHASVEAGRILQLESGPTLSDGTAGGIEAGAITLEPCRKLVDEWIDVSEAEIGSAMRLFMETHHQMVEGSAAVAIAGYLKSMPRLGTGNAVVIVCGANLSMSTLRTVLENG